MRPRRLFLLIGSFRRLLRHSDSLFAGGRQARPVDSVHPQKHPGDDHRKRHNDQPGIDTEQRRKRQLAVVAELEKIILNQRIDFRVQRRADQDAENAAKQTV